MGRDKEHSPRILWDELSLILDGDSDFEVERTTYDEIHVRCKRVEAFHDIPVLAKLFGTILFVDYRFTVIKETRNGKVPKDDEMVYVFEIRTKKLIYKGTVIVRR